MNSLIFREAYETNVENVIFPSCTVMYEDLDRPVKEEDFKGFIGPVRFYNRALSQEELDQNHEAEIGRFRS